jgi:nucleoside-diphosphate-sugar epimerase
VLKKLLRAGNHAVTALVHSTASAERLRKLTAGTAARVLQADLGAELPDVVRGTRFAAVVHCAAHVTKDEDLARAKLYATNVRGTANLLAAIGDRAEHLVYISSLAVYAQAAAERAITETAECEPPTFYGASKLIGERMAQMHCATIGAGLTILRTHSLYGPGEIQARALPAFFNCALTGKPIYLAGMGRAKRNYVFVNDAADAVLTCLDARRFGIANVAGAQVFSLSELAHEVVRACGNNSAVWQLPGASRDLVLDTTHAREAFGITCNTSIAQGVAAQRDWLSTRAQAARDFYEFL